MLVVIYVRVLVFSSSLVKVLFSFSLPSSFPPSFLPPPRSVCLVSARNAVAPWLTAAPCPVSLLPIPSPLPAWWVRAPNAVPSAVPRPSILPPVFCHRLLCCFVCLGEVFRSLTLLYVIALLTGRPPPTPIPTPPPTPRAPRALWGDSKAIPNGKLFWMDGNF